MAYVNYKNSPSEETPLTGGATGNLNIMQENGTTHGTDTKLGYSQLFLNDHLVNVSNEVDEDYRVNFIKGENLIDKNSVEVGNGIITNEGAFSANTTNKCILTYIEVEENKTYTLNYNGLYRVVFYNSSKTTISANANVSSPYTFTTPANTKYIRISGDLNINLDTMRLEEGSSIISPSIVVDNEEIYSKPTVLWQNPNPTSVFAGQTITLNDNLDNYKWYEIVYRFSYTNDVYFNTGKIPFNKPTILYLPSNMFRRRSISNITNTTLTFDNTLLFSSYGQAVADATITNEFIVPLQVIGYK